MKIVCNRLLTRRTRKYIQGKLNAPYDSFNAVREHFFVGEKMANTLLLNGNWDIHVDDAGNIATVTDDYAIAQNIANAVRLFVGDAYFEKSKGIPYFESVLGERYATSQSVLIHRWRQAALSVTGVTDCEPTPIYDNDGRVIGGNIIATTVNGTQVQVEV